VIITDLHDNPDSGAESPFYFKKHRMIASFAEFDPEKVVQPSYFT